MSQSSETPALFRSCLWGIRVQDFPFPTNRILLQYRLNRLFVVHVYCHTKDTVRTKVFFIFFMGFSKFQRKSWSLFLSNTCTLACCQKGSEMVRLKAHLLCCLLDGQPAALTDLMQMRASFTLRSSLRWYSVTPDSNQVLNSF